MSAGTGGARPEPTRMAREIAEQPEAVERTLHTLLPLRAEIREIVGDRRHVVLVARGSSDNAAVYGRYLLEVQAGMSTSMGVPSVATHYRRDRDLSDTVVVSLSQSGGTDEIINTQRWARECGAVTVAVTNERESTLAAEADVALVTDAGPEVAVPATKSYTAQLTALAVLAAALSPEHEAFDQELRRVPEAMRALLDVCAGHADGILDDAVGAIAASTTTLVVGRGLVLGTAMEIALKLEETCLRPVRALSYADLRHGPIAVVTRGVAVVLVAAADGPLLVGLTSLAADLRERGAAVIGCGGDDQFQAACDLALPGPALSEPLAPLGLALPGQLVVESLARRLGLDPDAPRGLSKVTQTD